MAIVRIPDENRTLNDPSAIKSFLATLGIDYERWEPSHPVTADATAEEILAMSDEEMKEKLPIKRVVAP